MVESEWGVMGKVWEVLTWVMQVGRCDLLSSSLLKWAGPLRAADNAVLRYRGMVSILKSTAEEGEGEKSALGGKSASSEQTFMKRKKSVSDSETTRQQFMELCKGNLYITTIHTINSAVIKLSKLTKVPSSLHWLSLLSSSCPATIPLPRSSPTPAAILPPTSHLPPVSLPFLHHHFPEAPSLPLVYLESPFHLPFPLSLPLPLPLLLPLALSTISRAQALAGAGVGGFEGHRRAWQGGRSEGRALKVLRRLAKASEDCAVSVIRIGVRVRVRVHVGMRPA